MVVRIVLVEDATSISAKVSTTFMDISFDRDVGVMTSMMLSWFRGCGNWCNER
jgi:hypothetical protein